MEKKKKWDNGNNRTQEDIERNNKQQNNTQHKATLRTSLIRHIQSKHEGIKYPCSECDYKASERGQLRKHFKSKHENVKSMSL